MFSEYYLYSDDYTKLPDWKQWNVGTILQHPTLDLLIKIGIFDFGHQIDILPNTSTPQNLGLTNILTDQLPIKLIPASTDLLTIPILENQINGAPLTYSKKPLSKKLINSYLNQEEVIFYNFSEEKEDIGNNNWIIIKWKYLTNGISFDILHTFTSSKDGLCLSLEYLAESGK